MTSLRALILLTVVLFTAACGAISPEVTPFYTPPDPLPPGKPGEIIRTEPIETHSPDLYAWRVMYHSRDLNGRDMAVTGLFAAPAAPPPSGGYPCPPSRTARTKHADAPSNCPIPASP